MIVLSQSCVQIQIVSKDSRIWNDNSARKFGSLDAPPVSGGTTTRIGLPLKVTVLPTVRSAQPGKHGSAVSAPWSPQSAERPNMRIAPSMGPASSCSIWSRHGSTPAKKPGCLPITWPASACSQNVTFPSGWSPLPNDAGSFRQMNSL